jgi:Uma2 family endonuclease
MRMTEEEFVEWQKGIEHGKAEWSDGEVTVMMAPVSGQHDDLHLWLARVLGTYVEDRDLGKVKGPQFVSRLTWPGDPPHASRREADLLFIQKSRLHLLKPNYFEGAPDLIMEIVSPESQARDWREKYLEYAAAGVREYWIIDPLGQNVEACALQAKGEYLQMEQADGRFHSTVVAGWYLKPSWLWQPQLPRSREILAELGIK